MVNQHSTYSIDFEIEGDNDTWAADWDYENKRWELSYMETISTFRRWDKHREMIDDKYGRIAFETIVERFGLPVGVLLEEVARMSPRELSRLGTKDPVSCTIGDDRRASEVGEIW